MPLEPLLPLFHRLNREHFQGSLAPEGKPLVNLRWSDGRLSRTAGFYRRGRRASGEDLCEIVLSRPLLDPLPREATLSTLCHEMIHAWVDRVLQVREVHGPRFRECMARINASQQQFQITLRHRYPVPRSERGPRWLARCPSCGVEAPYQRRVRGLACRLCCERFHGGRWHPSCVLIYAPGPGVVLSPAVAPATSPAALPSPASIPAQGLPR